MKTLFYLLFPLLLWSCSDNEDEYILREEESALSDSIHIRLLSENNLPIMQNGFVNIKYSSNHLPIKVLGDLVKFNEGVGTYYMFDPYRYEEYQYNGNKVTRLIKNTENSDVNSEKVIFTLEDKKVILSEEINPNNSSGFKKITKFIYQNNKIYKKLNYWLDSSNGSYVNFGIEYLYFFNHKNNLDSIVSQNVVLDSNLNTSYDSNRFKSKTIKILKNYDNSKNPFKQLFLLDRFYDRSLSANNYRHVIEKTYLDNELTNYNEFDIQYFYDNNEIDLTR